MEKTAWFDQTGKKSEKDPWFSDIDDLMHDHFLDDSGEQQIEKVPKHSSCQERRERKQMGKRQRRLVDGKQRLVLRKVHTRRDPPVDPVNRLFRGLTVIAPTHTHPQIPLFRELAHAHHQLHDVSLANPVAQLDPASLLDLSLRGTSPILPPQ